MDPSEKELEEQLMEIGRELLKPPSSSTEALLTVLDKAECLLTNVEQSPTTSMQDAIVPLMKALVSDELLEHSDTNVKVTVTSCITEITRITAPDAPYDDDKMKVIFQLTVEAFEKLSNMSDRCYTRAVSILDAVARVRSCLIMLDLECDNLVLEMFQCFLKLIRSNHPHAVFSAMETIMTTVLNESEEISLDLLSTILASVKKENQEVAPISWKLGEKVISSCAAKLQPYIMGAVQLFGSALDDYAPIVTSICQNETKKKIDAEKHVANEKSFEKETISNEPLPVTKRQIPNENIGEHSRTDGVVGSLTSNGTTATRSSNLIKASSRKSQQHHSKPSKIIDAEVITEPDNLGSIKAENSLDSVPKKRGRKPNSLMNPEEGYDHHWIGSGWKKPVLANRRKSCGQETKFSPVKLNVEKASLPTVEKETSSDVEEKGIQSEVSGSGKIHKNMNKIEEKSQGSWRKFKIVKSKKGKVTLEPGSAVSEENLSVHSDCEEQPERLTTELRVKSTKEDGSLVQKDVGMKSMGTNMDKNIYKSSTSQKRVSRSAKLDRNDYLEETPKTKVMRKDAIKKKEAMEISDSGEELVGRRIKVWWPMDRKFYEGVVCSFEPVKKNHKVLYDDGDEEILNLKNQRYELIDDDVLVEDEEMAVPKSEASSDILQKREKKIKSESAIKENLSSSTRRGKASARKKSNVKSVKSSGKAACSPMLEKPMISNDSTDDASSPDDSLNENDKKLIDIIKRKRTSTSMNSKQKTEGGPASSAKEKSLGK